jgi:LacI family transcriptional regulator, galactose operon repressor
MARSGRSPQVTMHDVARTAGVSVGTVSNVLRGRTPVAEPTRERVLAAIERLGYRRNEVARALKENATRTLGVVVPGSVNPFYASLTVQVERTARRESYGVLVADTDGDPDIEADQVSALADRRVDGVIFAAVTEGSTIPVEMLDRGIPVVLVSFGAGNDARLGVVDVDEFAAMEEVTAHLVGLGHERIAFAHSGEREEAVDRRPLALRTALERRGLTLARLDDAPTAVCCTNDAVAIDLIDRLLRAGEQVPGTVSVVGFDDIPLAAHAAIDLTTVHQDAEEMGRTATDMLLSALGAGRHVSSRVVLPAELVVRGSTGPAQPARVA